VRVVEGGREGREGREGGRGRRGGGEEGRAREGWEGREGKERGRCPNLWDESTFKSKLADGQTDSGIAGLVWAIVWGMNTLSLWSTGRRARLQLHSHFMNTISLEHTMNTLHGPEELRSTPG
jgi:hypothetical protein